MLSVTVQMPYAEDPNIIFKFPLLKMITQRCMRVIAGYYNVHMFNSYKFEPEVVYKMLAVAVLLILRLFHYVSSRNQPCLRDSKCTLSSGCSRNATVAVVRVNNE